MGREHPVADSPTSVTIDQWVGLNREIAALVRAGVPLESGLLAAALEGQDGQSSLLRRIAGRMERGQSLADALAGEGAELPSIYRAVVQAGVKSGRLPQALEAMSTLAELQAGLRRQMRIACIYPVIVSALAYLLFVGVVWGLVPRLNEMYASIRLPPSGLSAMLSRWQQSVVWWGPAAPAVVVAVVLAIWWLRSAGVIGMRPSLWTRLPIVRGIIRNAEAGVFCEILSMLVAHETPLPEALTLAGDAIGTPELQTSARRLADSLAQGRPLTQALSATSSLPPLLQWVLASGAAGGDLGAALQRAARMYQQRARSTADWFQLLAPVGLVAVLGGGAVLTYALTVFGPLIDLIDHLTIEPFQ